MQKNNRGFTIVELIVVVTVIAILAGITVVSYGSWQQRVATDTLKSDLTAATGAMESARNFNNGYPTAVPSTFNESSGVVITGGGSTNGKTFCLNGTLTKYTTVKFFTTNGQKNPQSGTCTIVN